MTQRVAVQTRLAPEVFERARALCEFQELSLSEWLRALVYDVCGDEEGAGPRNQRQSMARDLTFTVIALEGMLKGHTDRELRGRVHQAYSRKLEERGLPKSSSRGDER